jgi:transcriptional regulator with XRE-family HTH domain
LNISRTSVGLAVRAARNAASLSLSDTSAKTKISVSALSRIENGLRSLEFIEASQLANTLNVTLDHFCLLAAAIEKDGIADRALGQREALTSLRNIQRLAVLCAIEAAS